MNVTIAGTRYPLSNDYDPDEGQTWSFDWPLVPRCESCDSGLLYDDVDFSVSSPRLDVWVLLCRNCGHEIEMED